jgi:hypothetical protein
MFPTKAAEKNKTRFMLNNVFFENRAVCEIKWKNNVELKRPQIATIHDAEIMGISCWKAKVADTQSEYMIIIAFPWQKWLRERA